MERVPLTRLRATVYSRSGSTTCATGPRPSRSGAGVDLKVVQEMLGHSSHALTADIYTSVLPELARAAAEAAARLVPQTPFVRAGHTSGTPERIEDDPQGEDDANVQVKQGAHTPMSGRSLCAPDRLVLADDAAAQHRRHVRNALRDLLPRPTVHALMRNSAARVACQAFQFSDGLFDDGVAAVIGFGLEHRCSAVGDEGVVVVVGEQCELRARCRADPAHGPTLPDQPDRLIRCANTAAGNSPADGTRFGSSKLTDTRLKS